MIVKVKKELMKDEGKFWKKIIKQLRKAEQFDKIRKKDLRIFQDDKSYYVQVKEEFREYDEDYEDELNERNDNIQESFYDEEEDEYVVEVIEPMRYDCNKWDDFYDQFIHDYSKEIKDLMDEQYDNAMMIEHKEKWQISREVEYQVYQNNRQEVENRLLEARYEYSYWLSQRQTDEYNGKIIS